MTESMNDIRFDDDLSDEVIDRAGDGKFTMTCWGRRPLITVLTR